MGTRAALVLTSVVGILAAPLAAGEQRPSKIALIGFLRDPALSSMKSRTAAFRQRRRELGYIEGKNITVEWQFADGAVEQRHELAAALVRLKLDVIVAVSEPGVMAAKNAVSSCRPGKEGSRWPS